MIVDIEVELEINSMRIDTKVEGNCVRDILGGVKCSIMRVITNDGVNVYGAVKQDDIRGIEARLFSEYLSRRHPYGEPEAAV